MPKYKVTYKEKINTSSPGEVTDYKLVPFRKTIRAKSFKEAREKIRKSSGYSVVDIIVTEVKKSWIRNLLRF